MKKYLWIIIISLLLILLLTSGCANKKSTDIKPDSKNSNKVDLRSYFPLKEGLNYRFAGSGMEFAGFIRKVKFVDEPLVQFHDDNGGTVQALIYKVTKDKISLITTKSEFYQNTNLISKLEEDIKTKEIILKTPLKVGNSWNSIDKKREIVKINHKLTVPAGTFYNVIKIKITSNDKDKEYTNYEYYAKNVGLIMKKSQGEDYEISSKLKRYGIYEDQGEQLNK